MRGLHQKLLPYLGRETTTPVISIVTPSREALPCLFALRAVVRGMLGTGVVPGSSLLLRSAERSSQGHFDVSSQIPPFSALCYTTLWDERGEWRHHLCRRGPRGMKSRGRIFDSTQEPGLTYHFASVTPRVGLRHLFRGTAKRIMGLEANSRCRRVPIAVCPR